MTLRHHSHPSTRAATSAKRTAGRKYTEPTSARATRGSPVTATPSGILRSTSGASARCHVEDTWPDTRNAALPSSVRR